MSRRAFEVRLVVMRSAPFTDSHCWEDNTGETKQGGVKYVTIVIVVMETLQDTQVQAFPLQPWGGFTSSSNNYSLQPPLVLYSNSTEGCCHHALSSKYMGNQQEDSKKNPSGIRRNGKRKTRTTAESPWQKLFHLNKTLYGSKQGAPGCKEMVLMIVLRQHSTLICFCNKAIHQRWAGFKLQLQEMRWNIMSCNYGVLDVCVSEYVRLVMRGHSLYFRPDVPLVTCWGYSCPSSH